jgi:hypothetical protein
VPLSVALVSTLNDLALSLGLEPLHQT